MKATRNSRRSAKRLRRSMSPPEALLWKFLQGSPGGVRFRRQYAIGPYVADFYGSSAKLVIEIDGQVHNFQSQVEHDLRRDEAIKELGVQVCRIAAADVMKNATSVASAIVETCLASGPLHHPSDGPPPHRFATGRNTRDDGLGSPG